MKKDPYADREARRYDNPIASRELILETMTGVGRPLTFKRLSELLEVTGDSRDALQTRLRAMVRDGQLVIDDKGIYAVASRLELISGRVSAHPDGYGFLVVEDGEDIYLSNRQMRAVFHGDRVQVRARAKNRRGRTEGEIVDVIERNTTEIVGRLYMEGKVMLLEPLNPRICQEILVLKHKRKKDVGKVVVARIIDQPTLHGIASAEVVDVLGENLTPEMEIEVVLRNHDIPFVFPEEVLAEVNDMPLGVNESDCRHRADLRDLHFVTIDGEDARDFDDAVYCEPKKSGGWRLFVAIADVSNYVRRGSELDAEAYRRGTSVYFPQMVIPMLPEAISNGLCSLRPQEDRLVLVCEMTISERGRISGYEFYEGVIHSKARMTYNEVAAMLGDPGAPEHIDSIYELYKVLKQARDSRGALEFETNEVFFAMQDGKVKNVEPRPRNDAHRLIEECMLAANVCAARFVGKHKLPGLYRVHEPPDEEAGQKLSELLSSFGVSLSWDGVITPADYQRVLDQLADRHNNRILQVALLRSLNQAVYQPENKGHFGLNYPEYTHFTSPIRRLPDLLTHRLIKSVIHSRTPSKLVKRFGRSGDFTDQYPYSMEDALALGEQSSVTERRAESAGYDVQEWLKCEFLSEHEGDIRDGVITSVTKFGIFVELNDIFVEGLVHVSNLPGEYFRYEPTTQTLVGERSGLTFSMADAVKVQIARVNVDERKIDFELVEHHPTRKGDKKKQPKRDKKKSGGREPRRRSRGRR